MIHSVAEGIYRIEMPIPWSPWTVNSYLIEDAALTLIDTGPGTDEALEILEDSLEDLGYSLKEIERIILTHAHIDHYGLGNVINKLSSAKVFTHPYEKDRIVSRIDRYWKHNQKKFLRFFDELDLPEEVLRHFQSLISQYTQLALPFPPKQVKELSHRQKIPFDRFSLEVFHLPGHSPGHIALMETKKKFIFSGDLLLLKNLPSPIVDLDWGSPWMKLKGMTVLANSIKKLEGLRVKQVFPGHWEPFDQTSYFVNQWIKNSESLQKDLLSLLGREEKTVYELTREAYQGVSDMATFNYLPEVLGILNLLVSQGKLVVEIRGGKAFYRQG